MRPVLLSFVLLAAACGGGSTPPAEAPPAPPAAPAEPPPPPAPAAPAALDIMTTGEGWVDVDGGRSSILAIGAKITKSHELRFGRWGAKVQRQGADLVGVSAVVDLDTIQSDGDRLVKHLKSPDFFDVASFPTASFQSSSIVTQVGESGATHLVTGQMTMRGVTKEIRFPATVSVADGVATTKADITLNRQDYGVVYPGKPDDLIADEVKLKVELVVPAAAPAGAPAAAAAATP